MTQYLTFNLTQMAKYESLSNEENTENGADSNSSLLNSNLSHTDTPSAHYSSQKAFFPNRATERLAFFLFIVNILLAFANIWATHKIGSLFDETQTMDIMIMRLPRADQYIGLSDLSREFRQYISFCFTSERIVFTLSLFN